MSKSGGGPAKSSATTSTAYSPRSAATDVTVGESGIAWPKRREKKTDSTATSTSAQSAPLTPDPFASSNAELLANALNSTSSDNLGGMFGENPNKGGLERSNSKKVQLTFELTGINFSIELNFSLLVYAS